MKCQWFMQTELPRGFHREDNERNDKIGENGYSVSYYEAAHTKAL